MPKNVRISHHTHFVHFSYAFRTLFVHFSYTFRHAFLSLQKGLIVSVFLLLVFRVKSNMRIMRPLLIRAFIAATFFSVLSEMPFPRKRFFYYRFRENQIVRIFVLCAFVNGFCCYGGSVIYIGPNTDGL